MSQKLSDAGPFAGNRSRSTAQVYGAIDNVLFAVYATLDLDEDESHRYYQPASQTTEASRCVAPEWIVPIFIFFAEYTYTLLHYE